MIDLLIIGILCAALIILLLVCVIIKENKEDNECYKKRRMYFEECVRELNSIEKEFKELEDKNTYPYRAPIVKRYKINDEITKIESDDFSGEVHKSTIEGTNDNGFFKTWNGMNMDELKDFYEYCIRTNDKYVAEIVRLRIEYLEQKSTKEHIEKENKEKSIEYLRTLSLAELNKLLQKYITIEDYETCALIKIIINENN